MILKVSIIQVDEETVFEISNPDFRIELMETNPKENEKINKKKERY